MARVTVEDCVRVVESRFELILLASERARSLAKGVQPLLDRDRDKNPVVALREIAECVLNLEEVRDIATYCDQNNWESIWFTEHHFSHEGMEICHNPLM